MYCRAILDPGSPDREPFRVAAWLATVLAAILLATPSALAQSTADDPSASPGNDDLLSGFDEPLPGESKTSGNGSGAADNTGGQADNLSAGFAAPLPGEGEGTGGDQGASGKRFWDWSGFWRLESSYNYAHDAPPPGGTDYRGLSKLRLTLRLELSLKLGGTWEAFGSGQAFHDFAYRINGRQQYTDEYLDEYENEAEVREAWFQGTLLPSLDLKVGRQIVVWGKSDQLRVVDVLNPIDNREPGLTDLEDLRLPVAMTKADLYAGPWDWSLIAIPEIRFNKEPVPGSDFLPPSLGALPPEQKPANGGDNTEYASAFTGVFSGWDVGFYAARIFAEDAHVADVDPGPAVILRRRHSRITMLGSGASIAAGNWLLKAEAARFTGLEFFNVPDREFTRWDGMLGADYSGFTDVTLTFEAVNRHLMDFDEALEAPPDLQRVNVNQYLLSYRGNYWHDRLELAAVLFYFGAHFEKGSAQRYQATYELATALNLTSGVMVYTPGDGSNFLLDAARDNDRLFAQLKWDF